MRFPLPFVAALVLVSAGPANAQVHSDTDIAPDTEITGAEIDASRMAEKLSDPALQDRLAVTLATLSQVLLDLPLAPLAEAVEDAAGEDIGDIDPDMTLRSMAPEAGVVPEVIERELPRAMDRMASMAGAVEAMGPVLREAARAMEDAFADIETR